jgi:hypothetical protein
MSRLRVMTHATHEHRGRRFSSRKQRRYTEGNSFGVMQDDKNAQ